MDQQTLYAAQIRNRRMEFAQHHINHQGRKLEFRKRRYLMALWDDPSLHKAVMSCVQSGKSEELIGDALATASLGWNVLYVLPKEDLVKRFVTARVDPTIINTPTYRELI
jgi:hypothetical protein